MVARVIGLETERQLLGGQLGIAALRIGIFYKCAHAYAAVDVACENGFEQVGMRVASGRKIIAEQRHRNVDVVELLLVERWYPAVDGRVEKEPGRFPSVHVYHIESRARQLSRCGVGVRREGRDELTLVIIQQGVDGR